MGRSARAQARRLVATAIRRGRELAPAKAPDKGRGVVVAGDRFEWSQGLEETGNLRTREVSEMKDQLDAFLTKSPAEPRWEPITYADWQTYWYDANYDPKDQRDVA